VRPRYLSMVVVSMGLLLFVIGAADAASSGATDAGSIAHLLYFFI